MTTLKRIVAVFLAVMLVAAVCSVAVAAADVPTLKLTLGVDNFEFTVYKIASLNKVDGSYSYPAGVDAVVQNVVKAKQDTGAQFLDALNSIYTDDDGASKFGTPYTTKVKKDKPLEVTEEGIYYCVAKANTSTVQKIGNAVIVWPKYDETITGADKWNYNLDGNNVYEAPLDSKVASGSEFFDKYFAEDFGKAKKADYQLHGQNVGDIVKFVLEGNVVGSKDEQLTAFTFSDDMCPGLDYVAGSMHVYYDGISGKNCDSDFKGVDAVTTDDTGSHFTVSAKSDTLEKDAFYTKQKVYITYQATVNNKAVVGVAGNPNTGRLKYTNNYVTDRLVGEETRYVWTFNVDALKYNGATNKPLEGATFAIASDKEFKNIIATGTSDSNGKVEFKADSETKTNPYRFAPGTYYVKETDVPDGFALSTTVYTVTISDKVADYSDTKSVAHVNNNEAIKNYPVKLPETGGNGTMIFTIIGGVLVVLAGAMFVIIMKKRSSSK